MDNNLENYMESMADERISQIHTAMPATIVSFDAGTCTASVQPNFTYYVTDGRTLDYPQISGVPVFMPRAGATQITYPVTAGDSCLIIFAERSIDEWMGKCSANEHDGRQYDMTDGFALVGMCPAQSIDASNVELINGGTKVSVQGGQVEITGNVTVHGTVTVDGDVIGGGISLIGHTHPYHHGSTGSSQ